MANQAPGDGENTGLVTGLKVHQFANAVLRSLSLHSSAAKRDGGIILPIDEPTWYELNKREFPDHKEGKHSWTQKLNQYISYYNNGKHGLGFDESGRWDFGEGDTRTSTKEMR
jgi:hypothetical protein